MNVATFWTGVLFGILIAWRIFRRRLRKGQNYKLKWQEALAIIERMNTPLPEVEDYHQLSDQARVIRAYHQWVNGVSIDDDGREVKDPTMVWKWEPLSGKFALKFGEYFALIREKEQFERELRREQIVLPTRYHSSS